MKYFLLISFVLLFCFSEFNCKEIEGEDEDYKTEELEEEDNGTDLELIPSFKSKPKPKAKNKPGQTPPAQETDISGQLPLTSLVSTLEKGTIGLFGRIRDRLSSRVYQVGEQLQDSQQKLSKGIEGRLTGFMQNLPI